MKKPIIYALLGVMLTFGVCGCTSVDAEYETEILTEETEQDNTEAETAENNEEQSADTNEDSTDSEDAETDSTDAATSDSEGTSATDAGKVDASNVDYSQEYEAEIKAEVEAAVASATSIQDEIDRVDRISDKYEAFLNKATTQTDMNFASGWVCSVWDAELNSLWSRISDEADSKTKEELLTKQRQWNAMKDEVVTDTIGPREDSGTIYPLLANGEYTSLTFRRCNILANELAKIKGENFNMPEVGIYGTFVDNEGTDSIYSYIVTRQSMEGDNEAVISIHRVGELEGTFKDNGNGELLFESNNGVKGAIHINGWVGASFEVTESDGSIVSKGEVYEFPFIF